MQKQLTVSQINSFINGVFDDELILQDVDVHGEIFEFKKAGNNSFITLKENDNTLNCVFFSSLVDYPLGIKVIASGSIRYSSKISRLSFVIKSLRPVGDGEIIAKLNKTRQNLENEGIFSNNRPLSAFIKNIALITSADGAVVYDFLSVLKPLKYLNVTVFSTRTQGEGAADELIGSIKSAIREGNEGTEFDVLVIARGGGSSTDLSEFNSESLAKCVFESEIPIISAVGHEVDFTFCDYAADHRCGTPSIAADMILQNNLRFSQRLYGLSQSIRQKADLMLSKNSLKLIGNTNKIIENASVLIDSAYKKCSKFAYNNQLMIEKNLSFKTGLIKRYVDSIGSRVELGFSRRENDFKTVCAAIDSKSPMRLLSQGYAKVVKEGRGVSSISAINENDDISVVFSDGEVSATIKSKKNRLKEGIYSL